MSYVVGICVGEQFHVLYMLENVPCWVHVTQQGTRCSPTDITLGYMLGICVGEHFISVGEHPLPADVIGIDIAGSRK